MRQLLLVALLLLSATPAFAKRQHVTIHKQPPAPAQQPAGVALAAIPVIGMFYDLGRRTSCDGDTLGIGGAGFDPEPKTGNFLVPAVYRSQYNAKPK
jgi:hypothetical protein